jgi:hypothetical protein
MLFCRSIPPQTIRFNTGTKLVPLSTPQSIVSSKSQYHQQRLNNKSEKTNIPLLPILNHNNRTNHYHYK